uniref:Putative secreted protein n=1 Tax=Ixodes ricinus TaxID=34613 RepID=A0A6B0U9T6_IXORI
MASRSWTLRKSSLARSTALAATEVSSCDGSSSCCCSTRCSTAVQRVAVPGTWASRTSGMPTLATPPYSKCTCQFTSANTAWTCGLT